MMVIFHWHCYVAFAEDFCGLDLSQFKYWLHLLYSSPFLLLLFKIMLGYMCTFSLTVFCLHLIFKENLELWFSSIILHEFAGQDSDFGSSLLDNMILSCLFLFNYLTSGVGSEAMVVIQGVGHARLRKRQPLGTCISNLRFVNAPVSS